MTQRRVALVCGEPTDPYFTEYLQGKPALPIYTNRLSLASAAPLSELVHRGCHPGPWPEDVPSQSACPSPHRRRAPPDSDVCTAADAYDRLLYAASRINPPIRDRAEWTYPGEDGPFVCDLSRGKADGERVLMLDVWLVRSSSRVPPVRTLMKMGSPRSTPSSPARVLRSPSVPLSRSISRTTMPSKRGFSSRPATAPFFASQTAARGQALP